jgi:hypothetical protein
LLYEGSGRSLDLLRPVHAATGGACIGILAVAVPFAASGQLAALASGFLALVAAVIVARTGHPVVVPTVDPQQGADGPAWLRDSL